MTRVLVLGSGAREHALAWKISQSPYCEVVFVEPGNAGIKYAGFGGLNLKELTLESVARAAKDKRISFIVIGPETLLAEGFSEGLTEKGFLVFGPSKLAARLETSKIAAKEFMARAGVPTAAFQIARNKTDLLKIANHFPIVLKYDGLAAGKGVVIAKTEAEVQHFADLVFHSSEFGSGAKAVLIEEFTPGVELSYLGLCDGSTFVPLASSTDHKRVGDNDTGPNTGGMGVISPSPYWNETLHAKINSQIVIPILRQMEKEKLDYRGVLYIGIMVTPSGDPSVLEFNARFGDPETQALLKRLSSDLLPALEATSHKRLASIEKLNWSGDHCVYIVLAAEGYPGKVKKGDSINGIDKLPKDITPFFAGVTDKQGKLETSGGRVLGIAALGKTAEEARTKAYSEIKKISFRGMHYRQDIGITKNKEKQ